jgi:hypothetical protein
VNDKTLGEQLHDLVEESQGRAYISGDIGNLPEHKVLQTAKIALDWNRETVRRLQTFINEHRMRIKRLQNAFILP